MVNYSNPVTWTCLEFGSCFNGKITKSVHWRLPANKYGILYESDKCVAGGQFHYITDFKDTDATQKLKTARAFRSMMVRERVGSATPPSITYKNRCPSTSGGKESTSIDGSSVGVNESSINISPGNLSSNWYDVLASTSQLSKNESSSYNGTAAALND